MAANKDVLYLTRGASAKKAKVTVVRLSAEAAEALDYIASLTGRSLCSLASQLIVFAAERVEIQSEPNSFASRRTAPDMAQLLAELEGRNERSSEAMKILIHRLCEVSGVLNEEMEALIEEL